MQQVTAREVGPQRVGDPNFGIRELRVSNFLLWQTSYTEMYVTPKLWPDFKKQDLLATVEEFGRRQRRYGAGE